MNRQQTKMATTITRSNTFPPSKEANGPMPPEPLGMSLQPIAHESTSCSPDNPPRIGSLVRPAGGYQRHQRTNPMVVVHSEILWIGAGMRHRNRIEEPPVMDLKQLYRIRCTVPATRTHRSISLLRRGCRSRPRGWPGPTIRTDPADERDSLEETGNPSFSV